MSARMSRAAVRLLVVAAVVLMAGRCWAVYYPLGPSPDEWGLKYEVEVNDAEGDKLNVLFTLADPGRLKPIYSATVVAFSEPDKHGGRAYLVKAEIELKTTTKGKPAGQVQLRKEFADRAMIRILTLTVDGRPQTAGAAYYDIPLKKFLKKAPLADASSPTPSIASPPAGSPKKTPQTKPAKSKRI